VHFGGGKRQWGRTAYLLFPRDCSSVMEVTKPNPLLGEKVCSMNVGMWSRRGKGGESR